MVSPQPPPRAAHQFLNTPKLQIFEEFKPLFRYGLRKSKGEEGKKREEG
jgi:hypothetical protein